MIVGCGTSSQDYGYAHSISGTTKFYKEKPENWYCDSDIPLIALSSHQIKYLDLLIDYKIKINDVCYLEIDVVSYIIVGYNYILPGSDAKKEIIYE